jgi:hypothetical protein
MKQLAEMKAHTKPEIAVGLADSLGTNILTAIEAQHTPLPQSQTPGLLKFRLQKLLNT